MRAFSVFSVPPNLSDADRLLRRHMLARLGLAWLIMMQVMMFAFPGYLRQRPMSAEDLNFLDHAIFYMNWISLLLTLPVVAYCAWPIWVGALRRIRKATVSMDVPVALGLIVAFIPSTYATITGRGEVYFESVSMFIAFLLTARYFEFCAQQTINTQTLPLEKSRLALTHYADRVAVWFTLAQVFLAFVVAAIWYSYAPDRAVPIMVAMFVISCPCAMAMAVPMATAAARARASSQTDKINLLDIQEATARIARQNLYGSMLWHLLMMPLAAIGLIQPWLAAITMLASSLAVVANSWRLTRPGGLDGKGHSGINIATG